MQTSLSRKFCVAPMMKRTDKHFRHLLRMLSQHAMLYTEMIACRAVLFGNRRYLDFKASQHPLGLQVGGSNPSEMARCACIAEEMAYDEININVGCPSLRVKEAAFGACLMLSPQRVADCVATMSARAKIPVTVKCRIGVEKAHSSSSKHSGDNSKDSFDFNNLCQFVEIISAAGCNTFIIHARKAILGGLSPKQNREIPPLHYDQVQALKREFPQLEIILNGGLRSLTQAKNEIKTLDGVMLGRLIYEHPMLLSEVDSMFYGKETKRVSQMQIIEAYLDYLAHEVKQGVPVSLITRHLVNWFRGHPGARYWRRYLSSELPKLTQQGDFSELLRQAQAFGK